MMRHLRRIIFLCWREKKMGRFVNGMLAGGVAVAAGAYYLSKNKDKGHRMIEGGKDMLNKAEDCLDMAEQRML